MRRLLIAIGLAALMTPPADARVSEAVPTTQYVTVPYGGLVNVPATSTVYRFTGGSGTATVVLNSMNVGQTYTIKLDGTAGPTNKVYLLGAPNGSQIDGSPGVLVSTSYGSCSFVYDGSVVEILFAASCGTIASVTSGFAFGLSGFGTGSF